MLDSGVAAELAAGVVPGAALSAPNELKDYAGPSGRSPKMVLLPGTTAEVAAVLRIANRERLPIVPRGAGTSDPEPATVEGAVVLCSERLNRILALDAANLTAAVEPGVRLGEFQLAMERRGFFFPPDPLNLEVATLGGATAVDARGPRQLKYGSLKDHVLGLEVVLADGTVLRTGANTVKSASGYDLTHLFVGSRGTLCFLTRIVVRLLPLPAARRTLAFTFDGLEAAAGAAASIIAAKVLPARLEVLDRFAVARLADACPGSCLGEAGAALLCELDGSISGVARQAEMVAGIAGEGGASEADLAPAAGEALWAGQRGLRADFARGRAALGELAVPRGHLEGLLRAIEVLRAQHGVRVGLAARPGAGTLVFALPAEPRGTEETARLASFRRAVAEAAYGPGPAAGRPRSEVAQDLVCGLKAAYDPCGILNPGLRFPQVTGAAPAAATDIASKGEPVDGR